MSTKNYKFIDLFEALLKIKTSEHMCNFLKDLCTPQELIVLQERWRVCQLLEKKTLSYREIHNITGASLTTITRVARFLKDEPHKGYRSMLDSLKKEGG